MLQLINVSFTELKVYTRDRLHTELHNDKAGTSYKSKEDLKNRILTDEKINGFVVHFKFRDVITHAESTVAAGFALYKEDKLTDMYTFLNGRGNFLFNRITGYLLQVLNWKAIDVIYDDNNINMKEYFEKAIELPWDPNRGVLKE